MNPQPEQNREGAAPAPAPSRKRGRLGRWLIRFGIGALTLVVLGVVMLGAAEVYTAKPSFCASCHIMEPYYESWQKDAHGGHVNVACVDCHYAPGERTTINAKLRGLSQVVSYFSGRYGQTRPRAYVAQESCMTSNCHGDGQFMDKPLKIGTVEFKHSKHLKHSEADEQPNRDRLAVLVRQLQETLGPERFAEMNTIARQTGPAETRDAAMARLAATWDVQIDRPLLAEFSRLEHRAVQIAQRQSLQCTDCHSSGIQTTTAFQTKGQAHFRVQESSCFTCHFKNQAFNAGTSECMLCHAPPQGTITVHEGLSEGVRKRLGAPKLGQEPVRMDHTQIVARKVDCRSCHADVIVGDKPVSRQHCERCHEQEHYFADWKSPATVDLAIRYHDIHAPRQRADCLDCHSQIQHQLAKSDEPLTSTGFLSTAMSDCTHCHVGGHQDQVKLLVGRGGATVPEGDANMMFGSRTNCFGCHTELRGEEGQQVMVATESSCLTCHGEEYGKTFEQWTQALKLSLDDAQQAHERVLKTLQEATSLPEETRKNAEQLLAAASADLRLVQRGKGVHNITYALQLLDAVIARCGEVEQLLAENTPAEQ